MKKIYVGLICLLLAGCASSGGGHVVGNGLREETHKKAPKACDCLGKPICDCAENKK